LQRPKSRLSRARGIDLVKNGRMPKPFIIETDGYALDAGEAISLVKRLLKS